MTDKHFSNTKESQRSQYLFSEKKSQKTNKVDNSVPFSAENMKRFTRGFTEVRKG